MDAWQPLLIALATFGAIVLACWLALLAVLWRTRPAKEALRESLRLLPDLVRLIKRLAQDRELPSGVRMRLSLLLLYLAMPLDLVPDFIPVIGQADDVIIALFVLRSVVRRAGPEAIRKHWPGTKTGLDVLWRTAGLPRDVA